MGRDIFMGKKRLKIAFINIYQGKVNRGGEVFVDELAKRLSEKHEINIIAGGRSSQDRWPVFWRMFIDPQGLAVLVWSVGTLPKIWREKYDVVVPLNGGWQVGLVRIATWLYGGKMVVAGQSGIGWDDRNNLWAFPNAFVAISTRAKNWAKKANPFLRRVEYIPNGVSLDRFRPDGAAFETKLAWPVVVCVGALVPQKRIDLVIRAVAELTNVSLLVVGDGGTKGEIEKLGKELLSGRFELVSVAHERMPKIYRAGDVFCLVPQNSEAFGIVFVEAMATNLPVVTIKDDQRREIVGNGGVLVRNPKNAKKLAKAINKALKKKWGNAPRRQAEKFSWDEIAEKYEKLFIELCE